MTDLKQRRLEGMTDPPRRMSALGTGYSFFVTATKFALPVIALVIVGIVIVRLNNDPNQQGIAALPKDDKTTAGQIELVGPKYEGTDSKNQPYHLSADSASRAPDAGKGASVDLLHPKADISLEGGAWVATTADHGVFDNEQGTLALDGHVSVYHDSGYEFHLQDILIMLKTHAASSAHPVDAQGPMGLLHAQNLTVDEGGDTVWFGGPATLTLYKLAAQDKYEPKNRNKKI